MQPWRALIINTTNVKENLKITHCVLKFENWKLDLVSLDSLSYCCQYGIQLNKFVSILSKKTSKNKH
jgi:hypothetical protein